MQYTQAGHNCVPSSLVLPVSDLASSDDSMPESRSGCGAADDAAAPDAVVVPLDSAADAAAAAEAAAFLVDLLLVVAFGVVTSVLTGVSADDAVDDADDEDTDDVGLRQVSVERDDGEGCPICETVLHRLPSGGIFA